MSTPDPLSAQRLRRPLRVFAALGAGASVLIAGLTPIAPATAQPKPAGPSAATQINYRNAGGSPFTVGVERALARAEGAARSSSGRRAALTADAGAAKTASFVISPAVHQFLAADLGIRLGSSDRLTGGVSSHYVVADAGAPTRLHFGLPAGDASPVVARTELVSDDRSGTLTVALMSSGGTSTSIDIVIPGAATSSATNVGGTFVMPTVPVLGGSVAFRGSVRFAQGAAVLSASGYDTAATTLGQNIHVESGTQVSYVSTTGLSVSATARLGAGRNALPVSISGRLRDNSNWSLQATATSRSDALVVTKGFEVEGGFSGTVTNANGSISFDLASDAAVAWTPLPATSQLVDHVEYSDAAPPAGSSLPAGVRAGTAWVIADGRFAVSSGAAGTLQAAGAIGFDLSSGRAVLRATGTNQLRLGSDGFSSRPATDLGNVSLSGALTMGADHLMGMLTGTGSVLSGGVVTGPAQLTLTTAGALLASYANGSTRATWSSASDPSPAPPPSSASTSGTAAGAITQATTTGTYTVSDAVLSYLTKTLGIPLGTSPTLSGKLSNKTLTISSGAPAEIKPALPTGAPALVFTASTITINESSNQLTVTAAASATGGENATLSVTIPNANTSAVTSSSGITATLTVNKLKVFGVPTSLSGSLPLTGTPPAVTLTGPVGAGTALGSDAAFASGALSLASNGTLSVSGIVTVGTGPPAVNVAVTGTLTRVSTWSLKVTDANAPSWQPISNLVVTPDFTGTISGKSGKVTVKLKSGASSVTWIPGANTSISVSGLTISNAKAPGSVTCNNLTAGGLWVGVTGTISYSVFGASVVSLPGEACIVFGSTVYTTTTAATGSLNFGGSLFSIGSLQLIVSGDTASNTFSVTGTAQLEVSSAGPFTLAVDFSSTGALVAAVSLPDLSTLGVAGLNGLGVVWLSTEDVPVFTGAPGLPAVSEFHLRVGLSITFTYAVPSTDVASLVNWGIPVPSTVQAVASLSPDGFTVEFDLGFGNGNAGFRMFTSDPKNPSDPNAAALYLNAINIAITLSADPTVELDGVATLDLPSITGDSYSQPTSLLLVLSGTVSLVSGNISVGYTITGNCGGQSCPWTNAFDIPGLTIGAFGATLGVTFDSGIPTPTFGFSLDGVILPQAIAGPIGLQAGASISIDINFDLAAPVVNLQLASGSPGTPALLPLEITGIPAVQDAIVIDDAGIFIAPIGGTLANGTTVAPGIAVNFDAYIGGLPINVDALVSPATLTVSALISVPSFNLGPVTFGGVYLNLSISPAGFTFEFEGGFTSNGFSYSADLSLTAVSTFGGASFSLSVLAGLPSFLQVGGALNGSVSIDGSGNFQASASGYGSLVIAGSYIGEVWFSYSFADGMLWQSITAAAETVAQAFENAYGWADQTVTYYLNSLEYQAGAIAQGLQAAFAGISPTEIASDITNFVSSSDQVVASALQSAGYDFEEIGTAIENVFGESQQALQNVLSAIGADAWDLINTLNQVFTAGWDGSYYLSVTPVDYTTGFRGVPLFMDVSGGSQAPGAQVIDYPWDGGANQHWYFQSLGDGLAYIVNQNSGQCLTVPGSDSTPGDPIQQWPCDGQAEEMWQINTATQNLLGPSMYIVNYYDGLVVDAAGASWGSTNLDQWNLNYNWNQEWTASPGIL